MKYVRMVLGVLVGLYALMGVYNFGVGAAVKAGAMALPDAMGKYGPLIEAMAWWHIAVLLVAMVVYLVAAYRLLRGGKAFPAYALAVGIDIAIWLYGKTLPVYDQVFTAADRQMEYAVIGLLVASLALVWWTEREPTASAAAA